jgi:hypothetical protein
MGDDGVSSSRVRVVSAANDVRQSPQNNLCFEL